MKRPLTKPLSNGSRSKPTYIRPEIVKYNNADIKDMLGPALACVSPGCTDDGGLSSRSLDSDLLGLDN